MKITINFNEDEKRAMAHGAMHIAEVREAVDRDEHTVGSFGEFKYDCKKCEMTLELKPGFVKASTGLIMSLTGLVKTFITTIEMFASSWFEDAKDLTKPEETKHEDGKEKAESETK